MVGPQAYGVFEGRHVDRWLASRAGWRADVLRGGTLSFFFYLFIEIHNLSNLDIWWNFLTVKLACWWLPPAGYHPRVCQVMSFIRSAGCFLFILLSMFMVLYVSAVSRFGCVAIFFFFFFFFQNIYNQFSLRIFSNSVWHDTMTWIIIALYCWFQQKLRI